jgi:hypothetical protein
MSHYDWWCRCCNYSGGIFDNRYHLQLKKDLPRIKICESCMKELNEGWCIEVDGVTIHRDDIIGTLYS